MEVEVAASAAAPAAAAAVASAENARLRARVAELEGKMVTLKRVLMAYQRLTSVCVALERPPKDSSKAAGHVSTLRCTAVNHVHKKALEFQVRLHLVGRFWFLGSGCGGCLVNWEGSGRGERTRRSNWSVFVAHVHTPLFF